MSTISCNYYQMSIAVDLGNSRRFHYSNEETVKLKLSEKGFSDDAALVNIERSDITKHVYEGGFKVWECSIDLCNFLLAITELISQKSVLELGCGAGLPGIVCLLEQASHVAFQDFNDCVLQCFTRENVILNDGDLEKCSFHPCNWTNGSSIEPQSYDIILSSETIYNEDDFESFLNIIDHSLSPQGVCWIAAKVFYFGLSGDLPSFIQFVKQSGKFSVQTVSTSESSVPRLIIELKRI